MAEGPISIRTAEHYRWGLAACDGWHLLRTPGLSVIEERMPPGSSERRHRHERAQQFFYVLAGELRIEVDGDLHALGAREGLAIESGARHQVKNVGAEDACFLVISEPPAHGDRVES